MMARDLELTELLDSCIKTYARENRFLEFKSNHVSPDDLGKYISSLSNGACLERKENGYLFFGVDDCSHKVIGTSFDIATAKKGSQDLELYLRVNVTPKIAPYPCLLFPLRPSNRLAFRMSPISG
jgi:ATP-dependent DNA helicase RecG